MPVLMLALAGPKVWLSKQGRVLVRVGLAERGQGTNVGVVVLGQAAQVGGVALPWPGTGGMPACVGGMRMAQMEVWKGGGM